MLGSYQFKVYDGYASFFHLSYQLKFGFLIYFWFKKVQRYEIVMFFSCSIDRMALQTTSSPTAPTAQVVGNAFVDQYYHILHHSPELVYRFYQESSVLSRPDSNGVMTSVTTMQVSFLGWSFIVVLLSFFFS